MHYEHDNSFRIQERHWYIDENTLYICGEDGSPLMTAPLAALDDQQEFTYAYTKSGTIFILFSDMEMLSERDVIYYENNNWDVSGGELYVFDEDMNVIYTAKLEGMEIRGEYTCWFVTDQSNTPNVIAVLTKNQFGNEG